MGRSSGGSGRSLNSIFGGRTKLQVNIPVSADTTQHLEEWENSKRNQSFESALVVDPATGQQIFQKNGEQDYVAFSHEELQSMRGAVLTHNHPTDADTGSDGGTFSDADLRLARYTNAQEIRAVSRDFTHVLVRPAKGWPKKFAKEHEKVVKNAQAKLHKGAMQDYMNSKYLDTPAYHKARVDSFFNDIHNQLTTNAAKYGIEYRRTKNADPNEETSSEKAKPRRRQSSSGQTKRNGGQNPQQAVPNS